NRRLYESYGVPADRLYAAPYAVDNERFARQADEIRAEKSEIRRQWGIPDNAFCVLFCGKFIPKKRPMDLVKAAQLLLSRRSLHDAPRSELPPIHLLFVGSGQLGPELRTACNLVYDAEAPNSQLPTPN